MSAAALDPRKAPQQPRAQATVDAILEAAARILERDPAQEFTTNHVAERAGVSVGSFYQYFPNKASLIAALLDREHDAAASAIDRLGVALAGGTLDEMLDAMAAFAVAQQFDRARLSAVLDRAELELPFAARLATADARIVASVEALLAHHRDALSPELGTSAARDCIAIARALVESEMGKRDAPPPDLQARVRRALAGYLTVTSMRNDRAAPGAMSITPGLSRNSPV
jgi:AcrR family transcriptional regulator